MGQPVRPIGQFFIGAPPSIADQCHAIAVTSLHQAVGQFNCDIELFRILELGPIQNEIRPLIEWREVIAREGIDVRGRSKRGDSPCWCAHARDPPLRMRVASPSRCWIIASDSALSKSESNASTQPSWALAIRKNCDAPFGVSRTIMA